MFCEGFSVFIIEISFHNGSLKTFCMIRNLGRTDLAKIPNISKIQPNAGILLNGVWVILSCKGQANGGISSIFSTFSTFHEKFWVFEILLKF